jgi:CPA2 family monovalent cation:H+ antiporter-2
VAVLVVVTTASKLLSGFLGGRAYGLDRRRSTRVALAMVARGEFSLVIAALAAAIPVSLLGGAVQPLAVGYVLVMSVLGTVLMRGSGRIERALGVAR